MEPIKELTFIDILLPVVIIIFIITTGVVFLNTRFQKKIYSQKLEQENMKLLHQKELLRSSIHIQEEERKRTAQDLHDELGATLSIMRMQLLLIEQQNASAPAKLLPDIENVRELTEKALASVRSISHSLMPPQLERFGLTKALEGLIEQIRQTGKINIRLTALADTIQLSWDMKLAFYRIIMELLNNTIKHAGAENIHIDFTADHTKIICTYADDGSGLIKDNKDNGLGFKNIQARVSALKGEIITKSETHKGFYACIQIPVENSIDTVGASIASWNNL